MTAKSRVKKFYNDTPCRQGLNFGGLSARLEDGLFPTAGMDESGMKGSRERRLAYGHYPRGTDLYHFLCG